MMNEEIFQNKNWSIKFSEIYQGQYIILENEVYRKGRLHNKVKCPYCNTIRYIRSTFLQDNNKNKIASTLCSKCNTKTKRLFQQDKNGLYFSMLNCKKLIIDIEDIPKIEYLNIQLSFDKEYAIIKYEDNKTVPLHRFIMNVQINQMIECIDHINHDGLDNRKSNLREASKSENAINSFKYKANISGYKNIYFSNDSHHKKHWCVQVRRKLKRFETFIEAYKYLYKRNDEMNNEYNYNILNDKNLNLRFASIQQDDIANGTGIGEVLFIQYCPHKCSGCHNPETWSKNGGYRFTKNHFNIIMDYFKDKPYITRLTLSGGDPLANLTMSNYISAEFKRLYPEKKLWIYTGYTFEDIIKKPEYKAILELCDVLVDGKFQIDKKDITLAWRGSSNQRVIDVQKSLFKNEVILYCE